MIRIKETNENKKRSQIQSKRFEATDFHYFPRIFEEFRRKQFEIDYYQANHNTIDVHM